MNALKYGNITSNTPKLSVLAFASGLGSPMNPSINLMVRLVIVFNVMRTNRDLISNIFLDVPEGKAVYIRLLNKPHPDGNKIYSQPKKDTPIALCMKQKRGSLKLIITLLKCPCALN